jgi:hypothetical protein
MLQSFTRGIMTLEAPQRRFNLIFDQSRQSLTVLCLLGQDIVDFNESEEDECNLQSRI